MRPLRVVESHPCTDDPIGLEAVTQLVQVDDLAFQRPLQAFDGDVVRAPSPPVHGDPDPRILENGDERLACELAALIGVENLRRPETRKGFLQRLDAEVHIHGVRQPPRQYPTGRPVHDCHEVEKATPNRDVCDVGAPHMVRTGDRQPLEQMGINPVLRVPGSGLRRLVYGLHSHPPHQRQRLIALAFGRVVGSRARSD